MRELEHLLKSHNGNHLSHLFFLQDKRLYWTKGSSVVIAYQKIANRLIVLGDPVGKAEDSFEAIKEFEQYAKNQNCKVVYYQVSPAMISHFQSHHVFKIGEEAIVNLEEFSLVGKKGAKLRYRKNKFERQGYQFKVAHPPHSSTFLKELEDVSDKWLDRKKEKGFSVSFYKEDYINRSSIGELRDSEGKLIAFASLGYGYKDSKSTIVDLMRSLPNSPHGTMDMLVISILSWAKENDYEQCSLGMCPLSNVNLDNKMYKKLANLIYERSKFHYNFKGLKTFKQKFADSWDETYLVYSKEEWLPSVVLKIILLVNKSGITNTIESDQNKKYIESQTG